MKFVSDSILKTIASFLAAIVGIIVVIIGILLWDIKFLEIDILGMIWNKKNNSDEN